MVKVKQVVNPAFAIEDTKEFSKALNLLLSLVPKKSTLPILSNIRIDVFDNDTVRLTTTDLERVLMATVPNILCSRPGGFTVSAKVLAANIKHLTGKQIICEVDGTAPQRKFIMRAGTSKATMPITEADEFPVWPHSNETQKLVCNIFDSSTVAEMLKLSVCMASSDETRPAINGVMWKVAGAKDSNGVCKATRMVTTDRLRAALVHIGVDKQPYDDKNPYGILPTASAVMLEKIIKKYPGNQIKVVMALADLRMYIEIDNVTFMTRLVDGQYPNIDQVVPAVTKQTQSIAFDSAELSEALTQLKPFTNPLTHQIDITVQTGDNTATMYLNACNIDDGTEMQQAVACKIQSQSAKLIFDTVASFNCEYLLDVLAGFHTGETVIMLFNQVTGEECTIHGAATFVEAIPVADVHRVYVLMPIRKA